MFTFSFFHNPKNDSIHLRLICNRKKAELQLGVHDTAEALADACSKSPKIKNIRLSKLLSSISSILQQIQCEHLESGRTDQDVKLTREEVRRKLFANEALHEDKKEAEVSESKLFGKFFLKCIIAKVNEGYQDSCRYTYKKMESYCSETGTQLCELTFEDINLKWLNAFDEWLTKQGAAKNTRNIHFKNIRTVINRAIDEELTEKYPFRRFKIRAEETPKRDLPVEELRRLFNYPVDDFQRYYLDYFKLIFLLIGINGTDLYNLTRIDNGRIVYRRAKTHKLYSIKVEPEAMEIIKRHRAKNGDGLLDITDRWKRPNDFLKWCNISLKKIGAEKCKGGRVEGGAPNKVNKDDKPKGLWPEISTYWARHSWASIAYNDCGVSKDVISQALGHDMGARVTEIYLHKNQKLIDEANRRIIDWVLYGKC